MRGTTDYWVNDILGQPFFAVERTIDHGLLEVLKSDIVPRLLKDVPSQPTEAELAADRYRARFVILFDREGYSPEFFTKKMKRMERRSHAHAMDESPVWRISHGQATCQRRTLATHRTALASTQASSLPVPRCKPLDYRKVLTGIIFVLKTGIPWEELPQEMGCGCGCG